MIQQESRVKVADNTGAKDYYAFVYWVALKLDMLILEMLSLLPLKMQHPAVLLKKVKL